MQEHNDFIICLLEECVLDVAVYNIESEALRGLKPVEQIKEERIKQGEIERAQDDRVFLWMCPFCIRSLIRNVGVSLWPYLKPFVWASRMPLFAFPAWTDGRTATSRRLGLRGELLSKMRVSCCTTVSGCDSSCCCVTNRRLARSKRRMKCGHG